MRPRFCMRQRLKAHQIKGTRKHPADLHKEKMEEKIILLGVLQLINLNITSKLLDPPAGDDIHQTIIVI